jgi:hypothetical protein
MGTYLQQYGVEDERRGRMIKRIIIALAILIVLAIAAYLFFHNYSEKRTASRFLDQVNAHNYREAYREWGCTEQHPCPNYDFNRFMEDWGPKAAAGPWKIASTDSCKSFLTVNVQAPNAQLQSLSVERDNLGLSFAPSPECQEKKWRWKQFFSRFFGHGEAPQRPH